MTITVPTQNGIKPRPVLLTAGIHGLLLLFLLLWRFSLPAKPVATPEMGMEVNLGTSADGSGIDQPMDMEDPAAVAANASRRRSSSAASQTEVERANDQDAPVVAEATRHQKGLTANNAATQRRGNANSQADAKIVQPQRPRYVYPGNTGRGGNSAAVNHPGAGEGNTTGNGDRGVPGGTPGSPNYVGSPGNGTGGISFRLEGRSIIAFPPREARFREGGRVVVRVTVDRDGDIVNKQIVSSTNTELSPIALRKLSMVRFNKSPAAPAEQFGNITFEFKNRQ